MVECAREYVTEKKQDPESKGERGQERVHDTHRHTERKRKRERARKRVWDKGVGMNSSSGYKTNFNALKC